MRILFIAPYPPTIIRKREFNFVKGLSSKGHKIYWICPRDSRESLKMENAYGICEQAFEYEVSKKNSYKNMLFSLFSTLPLQAAYCYHPEIPKKIQEIVHDLKIDLIHVVHLRAAQFLKRSLNTPIIIDVIDCLEYLYRGLFKEIPYSNILKKLAYGLEYMKISKYETRLNFKEIIVTTENERARLKHLFEKDRYNFVKHNIHVVLMGVNLNYFDPEKVKPVDIMEDVILFIGKMSYISNELAVLNFVEKIFPLISQKFPRLKLYVVGSSPSKKVLTLEKHRNVKVTGFVPDIRPYLKSAKVFIAPFKTGAGIQSKVLEAMAMETPVVVTPRVADPIGLENYNNALIAKLESDFANYVMSLLLKDKFSVQLGIRGRNFVKKKYSWYSSICSLENIYDSLLHDFSVIT